MNEMMLLILSIVFGVIMVVSFIFMTNEYKDMEKLWIILLFTSVTLGVIFIVLFSNARHGRINEQNLNECQQINGNYIVVGKERVLVGKVMKTVNVYGCVK